MVFSVLSSPAAMKTEDAIKFAGSKEALADLLGITAPAVYQWGEFPPDNRQLQIQKLTRKKLKAEPGCMERLLGLSKAKAA
jgi:hypothetical protein